MSKYDQKPDRFKSATGPRIANDTDLHNTSNRAVEGGERARAGILG